MSDDDAVIKIARRLFLQSNDWSEIIQTAAMRGAYDNGDWIQRHMPDARRILEEQINVDRK